MKKFLTLIITCFLSLSLAGCSSSKNNDDILTFFDALGNTLDLKSAQISGTLDMKDSKMNIFLIQVVMFGLWVLLSTSC